MNNITIACGHCKGTGSVEFTGQYFLTYQLLLKKKEPVTAADLSREMGGVKPTAMNNRLAFLKSVGLAKSKKFGRKRLYWAVPA